MRTFSFDLVLTWILPDLGCISAALSSDGGKQYQMSILWDPNKSISTSTKSSALTLLESPSGLTPTAKTHNTVPSTSKLSTCWWATATKVSSSIILDPWKWASLTQSKGSIISREANCNDCAHCVDLYTPTSKDSSELKKIRDEQFLVISEWIDQYWREVKPNPKPNKNIMSYILSREWSKHIIKPIIYILDKI